GVLDDGGADRGRGVARRALLVERAEGEMLGPVGQRIADDSRDVPLRVLLLRVRDRLVRRVRNLLEQRVAGGLRSRELVLEGAELLLDLFQLLDLLRGRPALDLLTSAQLVDLRD